MPTNAKKTLAFRWQYLALPLAVLCLSLLLTAYFYHRLPGDIAYHFKDGLPDRWMNRGALIAWLLLPQFFLALLAGAIVWGIIKLGGYFPQKGSPWMGRMLSLMGNMIALPQLILGFAMVSIFSYNSYQIHLMPLWIFALSGMGVGGIMVGIFFMLAIRQVWGARRGSTREKFKEQ